jgi:general stress protein YciG
MIRFSREIAAKYGRQGGRSCFRRHGRRHMAEIGAKGFEATVARHWQGDRQSYAAWLREHARFAMVEAAAEVLLASGSACVELDGDLPDDDRMF